MTTRIVSLVLFSSLFLSALSVHAGTVQLPRTGQTKCYDSAGAEISCAGTGQDGDARAGVPWPVQRFTDNGNGTVSDSLTGLVWLKNANCFDQRNWQQALNAANALADGQCGLNDGSKAGDWRLPNRTELKSLLDFSRNGPALPAGHPFTNVVSGHWSSNSDASSVGHFDIALIVSLNDGSMSGGFEANGYYVWPVRSGQTQGSTIQLPRTGQTASYATGDDGDLQQGVPWPSPRFSDHGNGTVTDNLNGLVWTKDANLMVSRDPGFDSDYMGVPNDGSVTWQHALDYVKKLNTERYAGASDWRLPNISEFESLIDLSRYYPALPSGHPFVNIESGHWSSTTCVGNPVRAWIIQMPWGSISSGGKGWFDFNRVWPVRGGVVGQSVLSGTVRDAASAVPIIDATVTVGAQTFQTDAAGGYRGTLLPGYYTVTASKSGYESQSVSVAIVSDQSRVQDFSLKPLVRMTVAFSGAGGGRITSSPAGIDCAYPPAGGTCGFDFPLNTGVTLTAQAGIACRFSGWGGDCSPCADVSCQLAMSAARSCSATFSTLPLSTGDVNGDISVNVFDALLTLQYAVGLYHPIDVNGFKAAADVAPLEAGKPKGDGAVNVFDALAILRHAVGLDPW